MGEARAQPLGEITQDKYKKELRSIKFKYWARCAALIQKENPMKSKRPTGHQFTARDIQLMISNPIYAGVGIYAAIVPEETWIAAAIVAIKDHGASFWRDVQTNIVKWLSLPADSATTLCTRFQSVYEGVDQDQLHQAILKDFLHDLRLLAVQ